MKLAGLLVTSCLLSFLFIGCSSDDDTLPIIEGDFLDGIFISHEGGNVSGSVSFIPENLSEVKNNLYQSVNGKELGTFQQSMMFLDSLAFIVVDNANTIAVVNRYTFKEKVIITEGLQTPRYMNVVNGKGYVTNWGDTALETDDFIAVLNLETFKVEETIPVGNGPERIVVKNDLLYVSHKGGFTTNDIVSVINTNSNEVAEIAVGDNPDEMEFSSNGDLWILCEGKNDFNNPDNSTAGSLVRLDTETNAVKTTLTFAGQQQPSLMAYENGNLFYYLDGSIYKMSENAEELPESTVISKVNFYGMNIKDDVLYGTDAKDFSRNGSLVSIDLETKDTLQLFEVGVIPAKIYFQEVN